MRGVDPRAWYQKIAFGKVANIDSWEKTGYNPDVGATAEDMWAVSAPYVWPLVAQQMEVVSSAAADNLAGAGIQRVQVGYLDANYVEHSEVVKLDGVTPQATTAVDIFRIQSFRAYQVGANGIASGNVDIRMIGGAATIYSRIGTGFTRARNQTWTVPAGKTLYVTSLCFSTGAPAVGHNVLFTTRANYDDVDQRVLTPVNSFFMPFHEVALQDDFFHRQLTTPTKLPATVSLRVSVVSGVAGALCSSVLRGYVVTGAVP